MSRFEDQADVDHLLSKCKKGDAKAWAELVERFQAHVYTIARRAGLPEQDAADVFQNTFLALYRSLGSIESGRALGRWLGVTAGREAYRLIRAKRAVLSESDDPNLRLDEVLAEEDRSVELLVADTLEAVQVRSAMARLDPPCRKLLEALYHEQEPSYQEIAANLGIPIGSIGPRRARCLERLRRLLHSAGFFRNAE